MTHPRSHPPPHSDIRHSLYLGKPVSPRKSARNKPSVDYSAIEYLTEEEIGPGEAYYEGEFRCEEEDSLDVSVSEVCYNSENKNITIVLGVIF